MNSALYLNDILRALLAAACECLEDTELGVPTSCFVSHNTPPDDCCDFLAVVLDHMFNTVSFPVETEGYDQCETGAPVAAVSLHLMRPCFPTVKDNATNPFPPPTEINDASEQLLIDARKLWCCVQSVMRSRVGFPEGVECTSFKMGRLTPLGPRGGCAGWRLNLLIELDPCCDDEVS